MNLFEDIKRLEVKGLLNGVTLKEGELQVWKLLASNYDNEINKLLPNLSEDELVRAKNYKYEDDRRNFIIRRGILRKLIGYYTNLNPDEIILTYNDFNKPFLAESQNHLKLFFNLSKSHDAVLYSFSLKSENGIDIEHVRNDFDFKMIMAKYFSDTEIAEVYNSSHQLKRFYEIWTVKEAVLKCKGQGLSALEINEVPFQEESPVTNSQNMFEKKCFVWNLEIGEEYTAALACNDEMKRLCFGIYS